jgi:hypothetical protein
MKHIGYLTFGLVFVGGFVAIVLLAGWAVGPLADRWIDFLFDHFDSRAMYFGPLLCAPVLIWPGLVACYLLGRGLLGKGNP